ncbi:MAG: hypothetical protein ABIP35_02185 [Ginsengibacter sp.]
MDSLRSQILNVTWRATHFGVFRKIKHDHYFAEKNGKVVMTDKFLFESPFGILGHLFNRLILTKYLKEFLIERNEIIKNFAESDKWKQLLV